MATAVPPASVPPPAAGPRERQGPERPEDDEHRDEEAHVADAVDDERLLRRARVLRLGEPEADEQVAAQPDELPADEQHEEALPEHEDEHRGEEQVEVGEEPRVALVAVHVADRVDVDEQPHTGDEQHHDARQRIDEQRPVDLEGTGVDPGAELVDEDPALRRLALQEGEDPTAPAKLTAAAAMATSAETAPRRLPKISRSAADTAGTTGMSHAHSTREPAGAAGRRRCRRSRWLRGGCSDR
jgi:hypothetical protein